MGILWLEFPCRRTPYAYSDSHKCVEFVKSQLELCNGHAECGDDADTALAFPKTKGSARKPSRLLKITDTGDDLGVLLVQTSNIEYEYTALSYCWGDKKAAENMPKTTRHNFQELTTKGLVVSCLTNTFRDAIDLTFKLGWEYIWIDAFCPSPHEAIYGPLLKRQDSMSYGEKGNNKFGLGGTFKTEYQKIARWGNDLERLKFWHDIAAQFSSRDITRPLDRVPALASIARQMDMPGELGRYLRGLWEDTLPRGLLWWSEYTDTNRFYHQDPQKPTHVRPKGTYIPSWSWLSVEGRVSTWGRGQQSLVTNMDICYNLLGEDPYGNFGETTITLTAKTSSIKIRFELENSSYPVYVQREGSEKKHLFLPDTQPFEFPAEELSKLHLVALQFSLDGITYEDPRRPRLRINALILRREAEGSARCKRIGIADVTEEAFSDHDFKWESIVLT
ncbi:uncharacterized protein F4822DRAFT_425132 [Hypoxylon trugodes]|uniref:uncharacterized protein n=1 Tax=Hypoxylon trugodes TaxID=326681 RepID=UPI0021A1D932|nr:uncharacterized protein F4822DRAFT_425132 [Hypoxylon trugodes]KAI1391913.1 hypothetical protein F4822DRAFT_425132 [Hypoxylon trugodes]